MRYILISCEDRRGTGIAPREYAVVKNALIATTLVLCCTPLAGNPRASETSLNEIRAAFDAPPVDCRPHTRWWWMGNALRKEDIAWQLDQMQAQGIGGVEQITMDAVYQKGNHDYLSPGYFELLRYAVDQARDRGMQVSVNFGGPGWIWGGDWVPEDDRSQVLLASMLSVEGPRTYAGPLPEEATPNPNDLPRSTPVIAPEDRLVKVVAGRVEAGRLRADSLVDITPLARGRDITWEAPAGRWQLMAFWLTRRDNANAVNHLDEGAMNRYCETLGAQYAAAIGDHFGTTVDSFFGDSFEVPIYRNGLYWADGLFERFREDFGYDLVPWLPALWWEVGELSPKVRYDVNHFLHQQGMRAFFATFTGWCRRHNVRARIQPYGFVTDILEGAGAADLPEAEITAGEKDAVPWFDTRIGPREYVTSGAHLYGRPIVTAEAFTYLHWEPYRATLEELKIATDGYFRVGVNKLYNHGYIASPERDIVPTRGFFAAIRISHENIWWPWYRHLAGYTARCCALLRQGSYTADVALYSPLANQWTRSVLNARKWTREFDWGGTGQLLMANGYAFDLVNDDVLQRRFAAEGPELRLGAMTYRVLILPDVAALPVETYRQIAHFVRQGGAVIALERIPEASTGMHNHEQNDAEVRRISAELFGEPAGPDGAASKPCGTGRTWRLELVMRRTDPLDWRSAPLDPFLKVLRQAVPPDLDIDLVRAGLRTNDGLAFTHRRAPEADIYFVSNLQSVPVDVRAGLRTTDGEPWWWNPYSGERRPLLEYERDGSYTRLRLAMRPYESRFLVFERVPGAAERIHAAQSAFDDILSIDEAALTALAAHNGPHACEIVQDSARRTAAAVVEGLPAPFDLSGPWQVAFAGLDAPAETQTWPALESWTDHPRLRHFSGRAHYTLTFELPPEYLAEDLVLRLSLGSVGSIAEIRLNGRDAGAHWMRGQDFEIRHLVRPGQNLLEIAVTNTLINRAAGLDAFPEVPPDLQPVFGNGLHESTPAAEALRGFEPLPPSGLLGPVRITPLKRVRIGLNHAE